MQRLPQVIDPQSLAAFLLPVLNFQPRGCSGFLQGGRVTHYPNRRKNNIDLLARLPRSLRRVGLTDSNPKGAMMAQTLVVVPPLALVQLFGVPELVRLPAKVREEVTFEAHGKRFKVKRISRDSWFLSCPLHDSQARFGTREEIAEDVGTVLETGSLPHAKRSFA